MNNPLTVPARDGIEAQRGLNDIFPGDPYPVRDQLKRGLDVLRAKASRGKITSADVFSMTDPLMDILARIEATTPADVGEEPVAFAYVRDGHLFALSPDKSVQCPDPLYSATALERVTRERDEARAKLDEVCLSSRQEWQRATSAEAKLAEARKVIEDGNEAVTRAVMVLPRPELDLHRRAWRALADWLDMVAAHRFLEETK